MAECWLKTNRRALLMGTFLPICLSIVGFLLLAWRWPEWTALTTIARAFGGLLTIFGTTMTGLLIAGMFRPRVAYESGHLLVYLRDSRPIRVPLEIVEVFFRGQGPSNLGQGAIKEAEISNIVIRIAEKADEWQKVDVKPALGHWCEGYITLNGAWCERIDREALEHLNSRLVLTKRQLKADATATFVDNDAQVAEQGSGH